MSRNPAPTDTLTEQTADAAARDCVRIIRAILRDDEVRDCHEEFRTAIAAKLETYKRQVATVNKEKQARLFPTNPGYGQ